MASTSAFEIGVAAAAATPDVPADGAEAPAAGAVDGEGAEVPFAEPADEEAAEEPAAAVTLAACLEPKMADTMLPKTLILSSYYCSCTQARARLPAAPGNSIPTSSYSIAVFVAVSGFLIRGLVSIADTNFIHASHCQYSVASHATVSMLHFARPSEQHRRGLSIFCAEVLPSRSRHLTADVSDATARVKAIGYPAANAAMAPSQVAA